MRRMSFAIVLALIVALILPATASAAPARWYCHLVQPGENLFRIGLRYGVGYYQLAAWNNISNVNYVRAGDCLVVSGWYPGSWPGPYCQYGYIVAPGENLYRISLRYGVSMWSIAAANGVYNLNYIQAGQCLHIPPR
ncbi:MAG TPA: LysM peptidoglycan-binding domain-containing protein [Anaerolineae bacterium]|nr:LysM peptidoglycan-binding domain-containing protein [Anaerolineae bacterium]